MNLPHKTTRHGAFEHAVEDLFRPKYGTDWNRKRACAKSQYCYMEVQSAWLTWQLCQRHHLEAA
jgi:hypothetical protein